jgi:maltose O-acetyltransferase
MPSPTLPSGARKLLAIARGERTLSGEETLETLIARGLVVGRNLRLGHGSLIDYNHCWLIEIGDDVQTAPRVHIIAHDASTFDRLGYTRIARVTIGNRVFLGAGVIVLPGVTIGDDAIIGAGSVVTRDIPPRTVAAGTPARPIMDLDTYLDRIRESRKTRPFFDERYTVAGGITPEMRQEQKDALADGEGFVV